MLERSFKFQLKTVEEHSGYGYFEGYAAVFDVPDLVGDVIKRGAFKKTLEEWQLSGKKIPLLYQHNEPIGLILEAHEDQQGLYVKGEINLATEEGRKAYALLKQGALQGLSIGFEALKTRWEKGERVITEIKLWEVSIVTFPAQEKTRIISVKKVVQFQDLPLADEDTPWDADEARWKIAKWASSDGSGDKEKIDWAKYRKAFLWYDEDAPENFTSYKMPIANVIDGQLKAVPRAIFAAAAVLMGARGGVDIPEADKEACKRHLEKYYEKMGREAPWTREKALEMDLLAVYGILDTIKLEYKGGRILNVRNIQILRMIKDAVDALLKLAEPSTDTDTDTLEFEEPRTEKILEETLENLKSLYNMLVGGEA